VAAVRAFNRFYTSEIGALGDGFLRTPYSLAEARVVYELGQGDVVDLGELRDALAIDAGYLSRILTRFEQRGLVRRARSREDGRRRVVGLTPRGRAAFRTLDRRSAREIAGLLAPLDDADQRRLVGAMASIHGVLTKGGAGRAIVLREPEPGDLGWVVQRHGALYAQEYGWNEAFEALVARVVADYVQQRDRARERAWIADVGGEHAGCVFCVRGDDAVAKLRLLLVEPSARGLGVGTTLVDAVLQFARDTGYRSVTLWTNDVLRGARRIYERAGFELVEEEPHASFGPTVVGQTWTLPLDALHRSPP
jgi:DNA-binding MarR family transcriptional regulator/GNAT superfamily N-acetyltransferase